MAADEEAGMWDLLTRRKEECNHLQDLLEDAAAEHSHVASIEELLKVLPPVWRIHFAKCRSCRDAAQELLVARKVFRGVSPRTEEPGPWFVTRVMAAIAAKEKELSEARKTWLAVPRFASRLALASAALLLLASTWLYERPFAAPLKPPASVASQESLFEAPPATVNQDDVLIGRAERNP
jgi:hypothetical protein